MHRKTTLRGYTPNRGPAWPGLIRRGLKGDSAAAAAGWIQFQRWRRANAHWLDRKARR